MLCCSLAKSTYWNYMVSWSKEHEAEYRDGKILLYREITMNNPAELDTAQAGILDSVFGSRSALGRNG